MARPITFLSDYGRDDEFAGVCHAVIGRICPQARVIDLTHGIARHGIRAGALVLRNALPFAAPGVHLAVVDPEVGAERRAVALRTAEEDRLLVGPDNGLLWLAAQRFGGIVEAVEIARSPWRLEPVSATFHGRDVFAPVAAHLAAGEPLAAGGEPLDPDLLVELELPRPRVVDGSMIAHALTIDRYGNVALDAGHEDLAGSELRLGRPITLLAGGVRIKAQFARSFADVPPGSALLYEDAQRTLAIAVNRGSAATLLGLQADGELRISPA